MAQTGEATSLTTTPVQPTASSDAVPAGAAQRGDQLDAAERQTGAALDALAKLLAGSDRPDLLERIATARAKLDQSSCVVIVAGEFKKGKSSLVNALVNAPVCPVDDDVATAKPMEIWYGPEPNASVVFRPDDPSDSGPQKTKPIDFEQLSTYVDEPPTAADADQVSAVRIRLPRQLLQSGLTVVDTPGVGGLGSVHTAATIGALPSADAVLFVTDASQELTAPELDFLGTVMSLCPTVACVMTKIDFYPAWKRIADINRGHLQRHGIGGRLIPTSATLRSAAIDRNDRNLNNESGYAELVAYLRDELTAEVKANALVRAVGDMNEILDHLETQLNTELSLLDDPEETARLMRALEQAKEEADRLKGQAARWQQTLNDGTADLMSNVEHDLRDRLRKLTKECEEAIDDFDPSKAWDEFAPWLTERATSHLVQNYAFLHEQSAGLAEEVALHFDADHGDVVSRLDIGDVTSADISLEMESELDQKLPKGGSVVTALRGASGGMIMLSAFSGLVSITPAMPAVAGVMLLLARKTAKDERERALLMRRNQAKQTVRKYSDTITFESSKECRDTMRRINRQLRDHFLQRAQDLTESTSQSLAAAKQTVQSTEKARTVRRKEVVATQQHLAKVRAVVNAVAQAVA